ncbi:hypothetical protein SGLAM104S_02264 [Streptomyces glaucescens]
MRPSRSSSIRTTRSWLATGLPADVFQPLRFQPGSQVVTAFIAYCESIRISSGTAGGSVAASSRSRAVSSATLLVARPSGPASHRAGVSDSSATTQAQPAGPGFPFDAPSHAATTRSRMSPIMPWPSREPGRGGGAGLQETSVVAGISPSVFVTSITEKFAPCGSFSEANRP